MRAWKALVALQLLFTSSPPQPHAPFQNPLETYRVDNVGVAIDDGIFIAANETIISGAAQWVSVSWSGVQFPSYEDLIALYPDGADPSATAPIKFKLASRCPSHLSLGVGTATFRVLNMRHPVRFAFVRGGMEFPLVAAWTPSALTPLHPNLPLQGHISLTDGPGEVLVQWVTRDKGSAPQVQWGTSPGNYSASAPASEPQTYTREEMCGAPANAAGWYDPGWIHTAAMTDLVPGERYYYRYGDPGSSNSSSSKVVDLLESREVDLERKEEEEEVFQWSEETSFMAPRPAGTDHPIRILAVADLGQAEIDGSLEVSQMLASLSTTPRLQQELDSAAYDVLIHNGDISYARGYSTQWDVYWDQLSQVVTRVPYMTVPGNHERDWPGTGSAGGEDSGGECGIAYSKRLKMPVSDKNNNYNYIEGEVGGGKEGEDAPWYSFDIGPVHFLQYSTEHPFHPGSPQHNFISSDLASIDRSKTPWVIVGGHRPLYVDSLEPPGPGHDQTMARALRAALEDLFITHKVDVTWHGHHHSYQRTCHVHAGQCVLSRAGAPPAAPVHIVMGHAGAGLSPNVHLVRPEMYEVVELMHGYLRVEANATYLVHQSVASATGEVMDEFVLVKGKKKGGERVATHRKLG